MDAAAMTIRCPGARRLGPARLPRHRVAILRQGYATVVRDPAATVWGVLWRLALADGPALDHYEEVAGGLYARARRSILTAAGARQALVYVGRGDSGFAPRPGYLEGVLAAARLAGLPEVHLRMLAAIGRVRRAA